MSDAQPANAAILYIPDGYDTGRQKLMGRQAAGEGFLKGFLRHSGVDTLYCYSPRRDYAQHFAALVAGFGNQRPIQWLDEADAASPGKVGTLYLPDPSLSAAAWRRRGHDQRLYSLTGITHTTASTGAMDWISTLITGPVQAWDALICTSAVVKDTVEFVLDAQNDYLSQRLGATPPPRPQLPVIPLGVDGDALRPNADLRAKHRQALGIGDDDIVALFVGRLSFHAKAHPLPMYLGLEQAAKASGKRIHLIQAGWFANDFIANAFKSGASQFAPSVVCHFLDGRKAEIRNEIWQAADLFTSLSDNFQETFGLTPIEAMAASLPSVVSDWNGYKGTVRDGIDGIRVATLAPRSGLAEDLADRHAGGIDTYDMYCGFSSQFVAIAPEAAGAAYLSLIENPDLRRRMGAAARERAMAEFDWRHVIRRYQDLWRELAQMRRRAPEQAPRKAGAPGNPGRADPFAAFATYPSDRLGPDHVVKASGMTADAMQAILESPLIAFAKPALPNPDDMAKILAALQAKGPRRVKDILAVIPEAMRPRFERSLVWLAKIGGLSVTRS